MTSAWARWVPRLIVSVLAGAVPAWLSLAPAIDGAATHLLEVDLAADTGGRLQVFYDRGHGIQEAESSVVDFPPSSNPVRLSVALPPGRFHLFRIDPNDRPGHYVFSRLRIVDRDGLEAARIPLERVRPAAQVQVLRRDAGALTVDVAPPANDPQLIYEPEQPILLAPAAAQLSRAGGLAAIAAALALLLATSLDRSRLSRLALAAAATRARERPAAATVVVAVAATLAAIYPLLLGRSLVAPGNGPAYLLYDQAPYTYGSADREYEDARGSDVGAMMWAILPYTMVQREALALGEWPLWNRYNTTGEPLWGQGQTFILDPLHLLSLAVPDPAVAMDLRFVVGRLSFAAGSGLTVLVVTRHVPAAMLVAAVAPFVGHFTARFNHPAFFAIVYTPWILLAYAWLAQAGHLRSRMRAAALIAIATALQLVGSTPKEGVVALAAAHLAGLTGVLLASGSRQERLARLDAAALGGVAAVLMTAPHWMIFLHTLQRSYTLYDQPQVQFATWTELVAYVLGPAVVGTPLTGILPLAMLAAVCALTNPLALARSGVGLGAALAVSAFAAIAFGVVPAALIVRLPLVGNIHHLAGSALSATIAPMLVVGGVGLAAAWGEARGGAPVKLALTSALSVVALAALLPGSPVDRHGAVGSIVIVSTALCLMSIACVSRMRSPSSLAAAAAAFALCVFTGGLHLETGVAMLDALLLQPRLRADLSATSPALRALPDPSSDPYRVAPIGSVLFPGTQAYWHLEGIGGPDALRLPAIEELSDAVGIERSPWQWLTVLHSSRVDALSGYLDMLNVRYLVARHDQAPDGFPPLPSDAPDLVEVLVRPHAWPRAFFSGGVGRHRGETGLAQRLTGADRPFLSVDEQDLSAIDAVRDVPNVGMVVPASHYELTPNSTAFRVTAPGPGVAMVAEAFVDADFEASINGRPARYFRVNHVFKAVVIPAAGEWHVRFIYRPSRWNMAWIVAAAGILLVLVIVLAVPLLKSARGST